MSCLVRGSSGGCPGGRTSGGVESRSVASLVSASADGSGVDRRRWYGVKYLVADVLGQEVLGLRPVFLQIVDRVS